MEFGIDGFPHEVRDWYRRGFGNITVRLRHAVEFARRGIEGVWFAFTPTADP